MIFSKNPYTRQGAVMAVSKFVAKSAEVIANSVGGDKPMGQKLESLCVKAINDDEDAQFLVRRIKMRFGINEEMVVSPKFNDKTLMIESYLFCVVNQSNQYAIVVEHKDADTLFNYLTEMAITNDEGKMNVFYIAVDAAHKSK